MTRLVRKNSETLINGKIAESEKSIQLLRRRGGEKKMFKNGHRKLVSAHYEGGTHPPMVRGRKLEGSNPPHPVSR